MKQFSQEGFEKAKAYLYKNGSDLDKRRFEYHFDGGSETAVLEALAEYQNEDGGFGHGLEPDIRTEASSVIATSMAFSIMREIEAPALNKTVQLGVQFLLDSFDKELGVWPIVPPEVEDAPHAWWWSYEDSAENFGGFLVNPKAAIAGHLQYYAHLVQPDFLAGVKAAVLERLTSYNENIGHHDFDCYLGLAEADGLPEEEKQQIVEKLVALFDHNLDMDQEKWEAGEVFKPLVVAPLPNSVLSDYIDAELVNLNLDIEIEGQLDDGSWPLGWDWSPIDQAAWNAAEKGWKGYLIVNKLRMFEAYGRLKVNY